MIVPDLKPHEITWSEWMMFFDAATLAAVNGHAGAYVDQTLSQAAADSKKAFDDDLAVVTKDLEFETEIARLRVEETKTTYLALSSAATYAGQYAPSTEQLTAAKTAYDNALQNFQLVSNSHELMKTSLASIKADDRLKLAQQNYNNARADFVRACAQRSRTRAGWCKCC